MNATTLEKREVKASVEKKMLPIFEKAAKNLFCKETYGDVYGDFKFNNMDIIPCKLRSPSGKEEIYWVRVEQGKLNVSLALQVISGVGEDTSNIESGSFKSFTDEDILPLKDSEQISYNLFLFTIGDDYKFRYLKTFSARLAQNILEAEEICLAYMRTGQFICPMWISVEDAVKGSINVPAMSIWGKKPQIAGEFIGTVSLGESIYYGSMRLTSSFEMGLHLKTKNI